MSKTESRPQDVKQPKTVQLKSVLLIVPYIVLAFAFVGLMMGWNLHEQAVNQAKADAKEMVTSLSKEQK